MKNQNPIKMNAKNLLFLLVILPLLSQGLSSPSDGDPSPGIRSNDLNPEAGIRPNAANPKEAKPHCDRERQRHYCSADYGGDLHTGCRYCGIGLQCPAREPSDRGLDDPGIRDEILARHNEYRARVREMQAQVLVEKDGRHKARCIPELR